MAQLTFPLLPVGLVADVLVNLEIPVLLPLRLSGTGPAPIPGRGLVDTGSDISAVRLPILQQLGVTLLRQTVTQGVAGPLSVNLYKVSLHIYDPQNPAAPWLSQPSLVVMDLAHDFPFDVLIGLDVLRTCKLHLDGPAAQFTLDF
jgi:hypothetical protein